MKITLSKNSASSRDKTGYLKVGLLVVLVIILLAVFSPWGAIRYYGIEKQIEIISAENQALKGENQKLREEIDKLTTDPSYIEKIAREKYGLIKNNEIIYQFPHGGKKKK